MSIYIDDMDSYIHLFTIVTMGFQPSNNMVCISIHIICNIIILYQFLYIEIITDYIQPLIKLIIRFQYE